MSTRSNADWESKTRRGGKCFKSIRQGLKIKCGARFADPLSMQGRVSRRLDGVNLCHSQQNHKPQKHLGARQFCFNRWREIRAGKWFNLIRSATFLEIESLSRRAAPRSRLPGRWVVRKWQAGIMDTVARAEVNPPTMRRRGSFTPRGRFRSKQCARDWKNHPENNRPAT